MAKSSGAATVALPQPVRCAIYTRKSTEEGLQQDFTTLDAQRGACEAYIQSQRQLGWSVLPEHYDDGGYTGANVDRPGLQQLLADVDAGHLDCLVVYKVDRLTRCIRDLVLLLDKLDARHVTLASVTESFSTSTPAGRMTLNLLLTFAQYEREMIAERTRDKMHAARRLGKWIGGNPPLGYDVAPAGGALIVNQTEAEQVRETFRLYLNLGSLIPVIEELHRRDWRTKAWTTRGGQMRGGKRFNKTTLHNLLTKVIYTGRINFHGKLYDGEHERIIDDALWNVVQERLNRNGRRGGRSVGNKCNGLLKGLVRCGSCGAAMTHTYTQKKPALYRYYKCQTAHSQGWNKCETRSVSAPELEAAVIGHLRGCGRHPAMLSEVLRQVQADGSVVDPGHLQKALAEFDSLWEQLSTWEKERFIRALISEVRYHGPSQQVTVTFHSDGIKSLCQGGRE